MDSARYRPAEALRWLEVGVRDMMERASRKGARVVRREGERTFSRDVQEAAGAVFDFGRGALVDLARKKAEETTYLLLDDRMEIFESGRTRAVRYDDIVSIQARGADRFVLALTRGALTIKPLAHLVSGKLKVPVGWTRNGLDAPYELLIEEIAARANRPIVPV
jgi:hypothetical protein